ncbi:EAL and HDOD domain-containing protein [Neptuniibacter marinus]|uniref:EAL and HDOD domain-containing protein n=1 Tax=Neptuniibacter marinus TaxID=1806670 RepID=UPI00083254A1|nr:HDOD domain-containing protein [Neptuniibacter marinus]
MLEEILLARQPILDVNYETIGYELLYRDVNGCPPGELFDATAATCQVLINAFTGVLHKGQMRILPAFMNVNEDLLFHELPSFAADNVVLEIVEDVPINKDTIAKVRELSKKGFKIALDDFVWNNKFEAIMDTVDIVKIDVLKLKGKALFHTLEKLAPYNVTLLAEKVESIVEFHRFRKLGFKLFQGYFFAYPEIIEGQRVSGSELVMMELLSELNNPDVTPENLEKIISKDPRLALRLLKIVNSATFSLQRSISTINEAIILLGLAELKRWAVVVSLSGNLDIPDELCRELLIRAKMCESMASYYNSEPGLSFLMGILSGADALFSIPMIELNNHIPISDAVSDALLHREGELGLMLNDVISFSHYQWDKLSGQVNENHLLKSQNNAIQWALESQKAASI